MTEISLKLKDTDGLRKEIAKILLENALLKHDIKRLQREIFCADEVEKLHKTHIEHWKQEAKQWREDFYKLNADFIAEKKKQ